MTTMDIQQFGQEVLALLQEHLSPGKVTFRGSFASGEIDDYSDVDLQAEVHQELDQAFFDSIAQRLQDRFGPLSVRYVPDQEDDTTAQGLRINVHNLPVFWRIDLDIRSDRACPQKWPHPFPEWSLATSAFWNVVWAAKYEGRGKPEIADHYMSCACEKLGRPQLAYSAANALTVLSELAEIPETDKALIGKLGEEIGPP